MNLNVTKNSPSVFDVWWPLFLADALHYAWVSSKSIKWRFLILFLHLWCQIEWHPIADSPNSRLKIPTHNCMIKQLTYCVSKKLAEKKYLEPVLLAQKSAIVSFVEKWSLHCFYRDTTTNHEVAKVLYLQIFVIYPKLMSQSEQTIFNIWRKMRKNFERKIYRYGVPSYYLGPFSISLLDIPRQSLLRNNNFR